ncbi:Dihydroorotate dehydrogenase (quinone), mitochondrial [Sporothrix bragantina]|uniref:Dihydroorotate dehydrogenase (Quinone), mitochondrial n=1 Tax=Sporothrix bragantina TaxID=671064 RepID=A0ABP0B0L2_9PEZI
MGSTSPKIAAQAAASKARNCAYTKITSPSTASVTTRPRQRRLRALLSNRIFQMALAAKGITRRVTRSMARKQALLQSMSSLPSPSVRTATQQLLAEKTALIAKPTSPSPSPSPLPSPSPTLSSNAGTIMIFNDTNGSSTNTVYVKNGDADANDSPLYLPVDLRAIVPNMERCGRHNCGNHGGTAAKRKIRVTCRDCRSPGPVGEMHCLPCGHVLCRRCLKEVVWAIDANLHTTRTWDAIQQYMSTAFFDETIFKPAPKASTKSNKKTERSAMDRALDTAGMTCCDRLMRLDRHMACLDAETAAAYWLVHEVLRHPLEFSTNRCGWPDCGQLLAPTCFFERDHMQVYYCVRCGGNSVFIRDGYMAPARSCNDKGL